MAKRLKKFVMSKLYDALEGVCFISLLAGLLLVVLEPIIGDYTIGSYIIDLIPVMAILLACGGTYKGTCLEAENIELADEVCDLYAQLAAEIKLLHNTEKALEEACVECKDLKVKLKEME